MESASRLEDLKAPLGSESNRRPVPEASGSAHPIDSRRGAPYSPMPNERDSHREQADHSCADVQRDLGHGDDGLAALIPGVSDKGAAGAHRNEHGLVKFAKHGSSRND
jgi:hypothetical protein